MLLRSPSNLHYPITITDLLIHPGQSVERADPLFSYFYSSVVTEGNEYGEEFQVERTFPTRFESNTDGTLTRWCIEKGSVIAGPGVELLEIEEPCTHDMQFGGMCAMCGKDMTEVDYNTSVPDSTRANISMAHGNTALKVSRDEAARVQQEVKRRLLSSRKLSLVVDLDQTIIHATVDPTVAEWQKDESNPNHEAVKDVRAFQLLEDGPGRGCWYYIKLRPGLMEFLDHISKLYECHIYTMGTRAYAMNIAKIVDPDRKIFGDRILSRDESGSLTAKNINRLFPVDTKMVVIIDDRGDVWKWSQNLIKVTPYDFFVGIGDINSTFLPKREELAGQETNPLPALQQAPDPRPDQSEGATIPEPKPKDNAETATAAVVESATNGSSNGALDSEQSTIEQLVSITGANDPATLTAKNTEQDVILAAQLTDRPLLQKQRVLDKADEEANEQETNKAQTGESENELAQTESQRTRHNLLQDNDTELFHLENSLRRVHKAFFDLYDKNLTAAQGSRVAALRGDRSPKKRPDDDSQMVPDVKGIMVGKKFQVLDECMLVFSGVIPLGMSVWLSDLGQWAGSFGASINTEVDRFTTHVIASKNRRTAKVRAAARYPRIKIVSVNWLYTCFTQWKRVDEQPYIIHFEPDKDQPSAIKQDSPFEEEALDGDLSSSEGEENAQNDDVGGLPSIKVQTDFGPENDEDPNETGGGSPFDEISEEDWKSMEAELAEASSDDDDEGGSVSDADSVASDASDSSKRSNKKRKRQLESNTNSDDDADATANGLGSNLQKRKKRAFARSSSLTQVATADENGEITKRIADITKPGTTEAKQNGTSAIDDDDYDSDDSDEANNADFDSEFQKELDAAYDVGDEAAEFADDQEGDF